MSGLGALMANRVSSWYWAFFPYLRMYHICTLYVAFHPLGWWVCLWRALDCVVTPFTTTAGCYVLTDSLSLCCANLFKYLHAFGSSRKAIILSYNIIGSSCKSHMYRIWLVWNKTHPQICLSLLSHWTLLVCEWYYGKSWNVHQTCPLLSCKLSHCPQKVWRIEINHAWPSHPSNRFIDIIMW